MISWVQTGAAVSQYDLLLPRFYGLRRYLAIGLAKAADFILRSLVHAMPRTVCRRVTRTLQPERPALSPSLILPAGKLKQQKTCASHRFTLLPLTSAYTGRSFIVNSDDAVQSSCWRHCPRRAHSHQPSWPLGRWISSSSTNTSAESCFHYFGIVAITLHGCVPHHALDHNLCCTCLGVRAPRHDSRPCLAMC